MKSRADTTVIANWRDLEHPDAGGAEVYCAEVARRLAGDGRRVVMLAAAVAGKPRRQEVDGYTVVRGGSRLGVYLFVLAWLRWHRRQIAAVIDSQNGIPFFAPLAVRADTPVVLLLHHIHRDQFGAYFGPVAARIGRWLEGPVTRWVYRRRTIVAVSPSTRRAARRVLELRGTIYVAPPGCQIVDAPPSELGGRRATPALVAVGRMVRHKRLDLLLAAMPAVAAAHPDVELHLVGDGPERLALEKMAAQTGARIVFHGAVTSAVRDAIVRSSWLGVNCTVGEGWGISVIEANACGVPVVGFRVPGLRESIRDGQTGWLVDDGGDLGARIIESLRALSDPEAAADWSRRTVAWAERADWEITSRFIDDVLEAERGRLAHSNRRGPTDLTTHVHVPRALVPIDWIPVFRRTDRPVWDGDGLSVLLPGTDLSDATAALRRSGLPVTVTGDARLEVRIARPTDLIHPGSPALRRGAIEVPVLADGVASA